MGDKIDNKNRLSPQRRDSRTNWSDALGTRHFTYLRQGAKPAEGLAASVSLSRNYQPGRERRVNPCFSHSSVPIYLYFTAVLIARLSLVSGPPSSLLRDARSRCETRWLPHQERMYDAYARFVCHPPAVHGGSCRLRLIPVDFTTRLDAAAAAAPPPPPSVVSLSYGDVVGTPLELHYYFIISTNHDDPKQLFTTRELALYHLYSSCFDGFWGLCR